MFGNWITRIPAVKNAIRLSESELGLALLGAPIGAFFILPFAGLVISKLGLGRTTYISTILHTLTLTGLAFANSFITLAGALFFYGFTSSLMDIAMNAAASQVEKQSKRNIMSTCHGMWSIGAVIGSALGSIITGYGLSVSHHLLFIMGTALLIVTPQMGTILHYKEEKSSHAKTFALPRGVLLTLSMMGFCILMSEGAIADWSAVFMKETIRAKDYLIGIAYAGFSFLMSLGRFLGDSIIPKYGMKKIVIAGGSISTIGLIMAISTKLSALAIIGFSITGLGFSCIVPILFISAANQPGYTAGMGIAAVSTLGYTGFLIGPPLIGFIAEDYGLRWGLALIMLCSMLVAVIGSIIKFR